MPECITPVSVSSFWTWLESLRGGAPTVIGSMLGLLALIIGALFNAHLNRRRDDRLRRQHIESVAAALYGEIILIRHQIAYVLRICSATYIAEGTQRSPLRKFDQTFLEGISLNDPFLYQKLAGDLGILPPKITLEITTFHDNYQKLRDWVPRLVHKEDRPFSYSVSHVIDPGWAAINEISPTLRLIEKMLHISPPASEPDTGLTATVIELEEIRNTPNEN